MTLIADFGAAGFVWLLTVAWGATLVGWLLGPGCARLRSRVCIGGMIGMGLMSWSGLLCSLAGVTCASRWPLALCLVSAMITVVVGYQRGAWKSVPRSSEPLEKPFIRWMSWALILLCFVPIAAIFIFGQTQPLANIDGLAIWNFKAKILLEQSLATTTILQDPTFSYCHVGYPLLVPFQIADVWSVRGMPTDGSAAAWHAILATLFAVFVYDTCRSKLSRLASIMLTLSLCSMRTFLFQSTGQIADVVLMYASLASIVTFLRAVNSVRFGDWIACGLCLAALSFVKNEGGAFALVALVLLAGLVVFRHVPWKQAATCLVWFVVPSLPWWIYSTNLPKTDENYTQQLTWQNVLVQSERLPAILGSAAGYMADIPATRGLWLLAAIALMIAVARRQGLMVWLAFAILAGQLAAYAVAFMITPWDLATLISMKMEVILLTTMPAMLVCLVEVFAGTHGLLSGDSRDLSSSAPLLRNSSKASKSAKRIDRSQADGDWRPRLLTVSLVLMTFFTLPNLIIALPPVLLARLNGKQPLPAEAKIRLELRQLFSSLRKPGDVQFRYPIPVGGVSPDVPRIAEMLYYFGNYELFPRSLRATADPIIINNGVDLLNAMATTTEKWPDDIPLAATLQVNSQPRRPPELVLIPNRDAEPSTK